MVPNHLSLRPISLSILFNHPRLTICLPAIQTILPIPVPVHHLGLFREPTTLSPVEYYNNLPYHRPPPSSPSSSTNSSASELAILLDPVIATGGTCAAAIQTLKEWGVKRVLVIAVLGAVPGLERAANEWAEGVEIWVAGVDEGVTEKGMIKPGLGDVGDRLFLTIGK
jgi:uracil phosphoribosyltransferase